MSAKKRILLTMIFISGIVFFQVVASPPIAAADNPGSIPKGVADLIAKSEGRIGYTDFVKKALARRLAPALVRANLAEGPAITKAVATPEVQNASAADVEQALIAFARELCGTVPPPNLPQLVKGQAQLVEAKASIAGPLQAVAVGAVQQVNLLTNEPLSATNLTRFDWRDKGWVVTGSGIVSRVKDQTLNGVACGCCWSFATIGAYEAADAILNRRLDDASEQNLLDCQGPLANSSVLNNCDGGWVAFDYLVRTGVASERAYPYAAVQQGCLSSSKTVLFRAESWNCVDGRLFYPKTNDDIMLIKSALLENGPLWVTVFATLPYFTGYHKDGLPIKDFPNGNAPVVNGQQQPPINHAIVIVGWNNELNAWAIKNSWGEGWGDQGFGYVDYFANNIGYGAAFVKPVAVTPAVGVARSPQVSAAAGGGAPEFQPLIIQPLFPQAAAAAGSGANAQPVGVGAAPKAAPRAVSSTPAEKK